MSVSRLIISFNKFIFAFVKRMSCQLTCLWHSRLSFTFSFDVCLLLRMDDSLNFALSCFYEEQVRLLETESERKREEAAREISVRVSDLRMEVTKELDDCISEMNKLDSEV